LGREKGVEPSPNTPFLPRKTKKSRGSGEPKKGGEGTKRGVCVRVPERSKKQGEMEKDKGKAGKKGEQSTSEKIEGGGVWGAKRVFYGEWGENQLGGRLTSLTREF